MSMKNRSLAVLPMSKDAVSVIHDAARDMTKEHLVDVVKRLALSHERLRAERAGATIMMDEYAEAIKKIDMTLRIEAAEYVPAIGDVFAIVDKVGLGTPSKRPDNNN